MARRSRPPTRRWVVDAAELAVARRWIETESNSSTDNPLPEFVTITFIEASGPNDEGIISCPPAPTSQWICRPVQLRRTETTPSGGR